MYLGRIIIIIIPSGKRLSSDVSGAAVVAMDAVAGVDMGSAASAFTAVDPGSTTTNPATAPSAPAPPLGSHNHINAESAVAPVDMFATSVREDMDPDMPWDKAPHTPHTPHMDIFSDSSSDGAILTYLPRALSDLSTQSGSRSDSWTDSRRESSASPRFLLHHPGHNYRQTSSPQEVLQINLSIWAPPCAASSHFLVQYSTLINHTILPLYHPTTLGHVDAGRSSLRANGLAGGPSSCLHSPT